MEWHPALRPARLRSPREEFAMAVPNVTAAAPPTEWHPALRPARLGLPREEFAMAVPESAAALPLAPRPASPPDCSRCARLAAAVRGATPGAPTRTAPAPLPRRAQVWTPAVAAPYRSLLTHRF